MHGQAGYKEHGFASYGHGKIILNSSNHCILNVLAKERDELGTAANHFVEQQAEYKFSFCSRLQTVCTVGAKTHTYELFQDYKQYNMSPTLHCMG
jgi:hypothetical protein